MHRHFAAARTDRHPGVRLVSHRAWPAVFPAIEPSRIDFALSSADGRVAFGRDRFDSECLGLVIGRIHEADAQSKEEFRALFAGVLELASSAGYDQILRRTSTTALHEIWALEATGFEVMDIGVTFGQRVSRERHLVPETPGLEVAPATERDVAAIIDAVGEERWGTRYESDPAYDTDGVSRVRAAWLRNSHTGRVDAFLVARVDGEPAAYVTCLARDGGAGQIELVGTLPAFRRRDIASRLLRHALAWFAARTSMVTVRTQITNVAAARLYERAGFTVHSSDVTYRAALFQSRDQQT
jgi:ribosomal protein S18 acetylase RimI-like enzyme